jgi:hypothetical protein
MITAFKYTDGTCIHLRKAATIVQKETNLHTIRVTGTFVEASMTETFTFFLLFEVSLTKNGPDIESQTGIVLV